MAAWTTLTKSVREVLGEKLGSLDVAVASHVNVKSQEGQRHLPEMAVPAGKGLLIVAGWV